MLDFGYEGTIHNYCMYLLEILNLSNPKIVDFSKKFCF